MKNELQSANTLVFVYDKTKGKMMFYGKTEQYGPVGDKWDVGYTVPTVGDSGSPLIREFKDTKGRSRYTFFAVASYSRDFVRPGDAYGTYYHSQLFQCNSYATKITRDILDWIKERAGIPH